MSSRVRRLAIALFFILVVAMSGCSTKSTSSSGGGSSEATPTPIPAPPVAEKPTYTVKRGEVVDSLSFTGRVAPSVEEELYFRVDGRVKKVHVERNQVVEAGTLLAELENDDLLRQLEQAKIELESAELALKSANDSRDYNIAVAKVNLEIEQLTLAQMEAETNDPAVNTAKANLQKAEAAVKVAQREFDIKARRADVMATNEALTLEQRTIDLQLAQAALTRARQQDKQDQIALEIERKELQLLEMEIARLEQQQDPGLLKSVERAKLSVQRLEAQVGDTQVVSPIRGKVTSVSAYDGRTVTAFKAVFIVADEAQIEITAEPMSSQLQDLAEGMSAAVVLSSYPGKELVAKIEQLPYPYGKGGGSTDVEEADKLTHISFDPEDLKIEPGDLVKVIVTLEKKDNVLWLPPAAIRTFSGRKFVVIEEDGRQRRADVTIGIESADRVEVKEGVEENQIVVGQ